MPRITPEPSKRDEEGMAALEWVPFVEVETLVSHRTQQGLVMLRMGESAGQMPPAMAREIAQHLNEAAAMAEADAFVMALGQEEIGLSLPAAAKLLSMFREFRQRAVPGEV